MEPEDTLSFMGPRRGADGHLKIPKAPESEIWEKQAHGALGPAQGNTPEACSPRAGPLISRRMLLHPRRLPVWETVSWMETGLGASEAGHQGTEANQG